MRGEGLTALCAILVPDAILMLIVVSATHIVACVFGLGVRLEGVGLVFRV